MIHAINFTTVCQSSYKFEVRFWTFNMTVYKQPAVLSLFYPYNKCNANIHITKLYKFWIFVMVAILKILNGSYHKTSWNVLTFCTIVYTAGHQYTKFHADVNMQTKVITIWSFKWWPFWKFLMTAITITRWYVLTFCMICYIAGHQYTQFHANIHMQTKVISILNFRWWPFLFF